MSKGLLFLPLFELSIEQLNVIVCTKKRELLIEVEKASSVYVITHKYMEYQQYYMALLKRLYGDDFQHPF